LAGFSANEHVDHSVVEILPGSGLSGGGDISASRTLDVVDPFPRLHPYSPTQVLLDDLAILWDMDLGVIARVTIDDDRDFSAPSNMKDGGTYILFLIQGTGGGHGVTWDPVFKWVGGTPPTLSTNEGDLDIVTFISDGTNLYGAGQCGFL
jgi:hypothetical protein